ncbi:MAG: type II toxin-antitoxin system RelE/ParE family toxin [Thermodesulfobacteriota bacterium]|nr:type II toxin-antitoxin system RelE/ParE family toxin [Thermodesulfobacteriota bacterium]
MKRVFRTRTFSRWMRKTGLTDEMLCQAVSEMMQGLVDGDLGGNLLKKRIGLSGRGKRGGGRTIVATNRCDRWFFLYGFEKNERANISKDEIKALRELAGQYLAFDVKQIELAVRSGKFMEVYYDDNKA